MALQSKKKDKTPEAEAADEKAWQDYAVAAIHRLYPNRRRSLDWEWGRTADDPQGDQKLVFESEEYSPIDMAKVEEEARALLGLNPSADYQPKKPLHAGSVKEPGYKGS